MPTMNDLVGNFLAWHKILMCRHKCIVYNLYQKLFANNTGKFPIQFRYKIQHNACCEIICLTYLTHESFEVRKHIVSIKSLLYVYWKMM